MNAAFRDLSDFADEAARGVAACDRFISEGGKSPYPAME
jgi:hypothetical protein